MNRSILSVLTAVVMTTVAARAGSISGKVSGVAGESVVYVDTIADKTFPAPAEHPVIDQKGLLFQPHITVVLRGTTVEFRNSDNVAHNVFWPSIQQGAKKLPGKNLGTWPQARSVLSSSTKPGPRHCFAMSILRWQAISWSARRPIT